MIKPAHSVSFLLSINIFVWQNVLYFLDAPRILHLPRFRHLVFGGESEHSHSLTRIYKHGVSFTAENGTGM